MCPPNTSAIAVTMPNSCGGRKEKKGKEKERQVKYHPGSPKDIPVENVKASTLERPPYAVSRLPPGSKSVALLSVSTDDRIILRAASRDFCTKSI